MCTFHQATTIFLANIQKEINKELGVEVRNYLTHKVSHSYGVLAVSQRIITNDPVLSRLKKETIEEFEVAALLHDIGRFSQHDTQRILSGKEHPHGEIGYNILVKENIDSPRILLAVKHHEKYNLSELENELDFITTDKEEKEKISRICHFVRDADKLQNLEFLLYNHAGALNLEKNEKNEREPKSVSDICLEVIKKKQQMDRKLPQTNAEKLLYYFSWIFDIHHEGAKSILRQIRFRERYADILIKMGVRKEVIDVVKG